MNRFVTGWMAALLFVAVTYNQASGAGIFAFGLTNTSLSADPAFHEQAYEDPLLVIASRSFQGHLPGSLDYLLEYSGSFQHGRLATRSLVSIPFGADISATAELGGGPDDEITVSGAGPSAFLRLDVSLSGFLRKNNPTAGNTVATFAIFTSNLPLSDPPSYTFIFRVRVSLTQAQLPGIDTSGSLGPPFTAYPGGELAISLAGPDHTFGGRGYVMIPLALLGSPFGLYVSAESHATCSTACTAISDFGNTALIGNGQIVDQFGNAIPGASFTAASGHDYTIAITPPSDRPVITLPVEDDVLIAAGGALPMTWTAVTGATQYALEFAGRNLPFANPGGAGPDPVNGLGGAGGGFLIPGTSVIGTVPVGTPPGAYRVRIIGLSPAFVPVGRFSDAIVLLVDALAGGQPTITAPAESSVLPWGSPVTFTWTSVAGATQYLVEFEGGPDPGRLGGSLVVEVTSVNAIVPANIPTGTYRMRILGLSPAGAPVGTFSSPLTFTVVQ